MPQYEDFLVKESKENMKQLSWVFGVLAYSFLAALIPGLIWVFGGFLYDVLKRLGDGANWFMGLSWGIKIPVFIAMGICFQSLRPLFNSKSDVEK